MDCLVKFCLCERAATVLMSELFYFVVVFVFFSSFVLFFFCQIDSTATCHEF